MKALSIDLLPRPAVEKIPHLGPVQKIVRKTERDLACLVESFQIFFRQDQIQAREIVLELRQRAALPEWE